MSRRRPRRNPTKPARDSWPEQVLIGTVAVVGTGVMVFYALRLASALER